MAGLTKYKENLWIIKNPYVVLKIIKGFIRAIVFKKNTLRLIELFPTFNCQLRCKMCSVEKYRRTATENHKLELEEYSRFAKEAAKMGAWAITILGGEPMMFDQLASLIAIFHKEHYFVNLVSNGQLINQEVLGNLKKVGLNSIYFSLESMSSDTNDKIRGQGTYALVRESLKIAQQQGLITGLAPVVFPGKLDSALEIIEYCHQNGINASGGQVVPVGNAEGYEILSEEENDQLRLWIKKYPRLTYDWIFSYFLKSRCPSGKEKIGLTCFGDVIACSVNPLSFGNIRQEPLQKILKRMGNFSQFKKDFDGCLAAEDKEFIEKYILPMQKHTSYPVSYTEHESISSISDQEIFF